MKEQIYESLRQSYGGKYGVADEVFMEQASGLAATGVITEDNLAQIVAGQDSFYKAISSKFDKVVSQKTNLEKQLEEERKKQAAQTTTTPAATQTQQTETNSDNAVLEYLKKLEAKLEDNQTRMSNFEKEKSMEQKKKEAMEMFSKLNISDNTKGLANKAQSWVFSNVKDDDTAETLYTRMKDEYDSLASSIGLNAYKPIPSGGGSEKPEKKWAAEAEKRKAQAQSKN